MTVESDKLRVWDRQDIILSDAFRLTFITNLPTESMATRATMAVKVLILTDGVQKNESK